MIGAVLLTGLGTGLGLWLIVVGLFPRPPRLDTMLDNPHGLIPPSALRARAGGADVTWCPLNYQAAPPGAQDVLDAERVDQILALVNHRYAAERGLEPLERVALSALAAS